MAEIKRQKLIHLHKSTPLVASAVTAVDMVKGEIAVRHATGDTADADSELYTLNGNGGIVSFPSKAYVDAKISKSNGDISGLQDEVDRIETAVGLSGTGTLAAWATGNYITGKTTFKAAIEALDTQAKANADAAKAAKSVVTAGDNITVTPSTGSDKAVTYQVAATGLVKETDFTTFKGHITKQAGVDGNSDAVSFTGKNYIAGTNNLKAAIEELDAQAKKNADAAANAATAAAKHTIVEGTGNITVSSADTDGQVTYTVNGSALATAENLTKAEGKIAKIEAFFNEAATGGTNVIDTLKEIQEYIATDETGASAMATKLENITEVLGGYLKGTNGATGNTVIKDIIDKKADATALTAVSDSVNHIKAQAGVNGTSDTVTFDDTNYLSNAHTLKAAIEKLATQAKTNATEAAKHTEVSGTNNITVTSNTVNGKTTYTVDGKDLATKTALSTAEGKIAAIEGAYVKTITIDNSDKNHVTATKSTNSYAFNFDAMVIDCGEY